MTTSPLRKTYYAESQDIEAVTIIRQRYGLCSDNDAVKLALRILAASETAKITVSAKAVKNALK